MQTEASAWLRRWEAQQQLEVPEREDRFTAMVDTVVAFAGEHGAPRVLDLGSGPGSLSVRVLDRLPDAEIVAIDTDPVLLAIGREALRERARLHFVDADLRGDWPSLLPLAPPFDAAVSTTALHWLELPDLVRFFEMLATVLRPGGLLLNGDRLDFDHDQTAIDRLAGAVRTSWPAPPEGAERWEAWWDAATAEPALADAVAERRARHHDHPAHVPGHSYELHRAALLAAGFSEVGTIWQRRASRVLVAIR